jgi:hypothetical protein
VLLDVDPHALAGARSLIEELLAQERLLRRLVPRHESQFVLAVLTLGCMTPSRDW